MVDKTIGLGLSDDTGIIFSDQTIYPSICKPRQNRTKFVTIFSKSYGLKNIEKSSICLLQRLKINVFILNGAAPQRGMQSVKKKIIKKR